MIYQDCKHLNSSPNGEWCDIGIFETKTECEDCKYHAPGVRSQKCMQGVKLDTSTGEVTGCSNHKVDHPSYYQGKIEVIDFIEDKELGFHLGNAIKYIARAGKKTPDAKEDIEKAIWYLERYLGKI